MNTKLALLCKDNNITNLRLTSIGNSIASGYSWFRTTKPLLLRNNSLEKIMEAYDINLDLHQYARAQNNLEATLKFIQEQNRSKGSNTQVYLCGAPDFLGFHITEIINHKLKRIAKEYANVIYVKPVKSKFLYPSYEEEQKLSLEENQNLLKRLLMLRPDIHYDEIEYLKFNNNIIASINDNYQVLRAMINVDRKLFSLSSKLELEEQDKIDNKEIVDDLVVDIISKENSRIDSKIHQDFFRERLNYYLNEREPYDFYYFGKKTIDKVTEEVRSKSK